MASALKSVEKQKAKPQQKKFKPILYLGLAPLFMILGLFSYYPALNGLTRAFFDWRFFEPSEFIGLENFRTMLSDDMWWESFYHISIVFIAATTIMWALPLLAVEMLISIRNRRTQYILRTLLLFPLAFPIVVTIYMWGFIYHPNRGVLNTSLEAVGLDSLAQNWLGDPKTALIALLFIGFPWIASLPFFVFLTGLQNIGTEVFEAAALDGCSRMQRFFLIDIPLLGRQFRLLFFLATISVLQFGITAQILTAGGPDNATMFPILRILGVAFNGGDWGYAATLSSTLFIITFTISAVILLISRGEKQNARSL
jgi:raffinose/stachyose/melibiose transport system permease protein